MKTLLDRFNALVIKHDNKCWEWLGSKDEHGYGRMCLRTIRGKRVIRSHRISWNLFNGEIPEEMVVCHHCDNPPCTNPQHLFIGTQQDNIRDRDSKGRCKAGIYNLIKTHCKCGQPLSGKNLIINIRGNRHCRACMYAWQAKYRKRQKEKLHG